MADRPNIACVADHTEAESAVAVAERGLASWREAKEAWLDSFAAFVAQEDGLVTTAPTWSTTRARRTARTMTASRHP